MKVVIVGAGAVGGYFGGRLAESGMDVTFLVREKRAEQLRETGLTISSPHGDYSFQPKLAVDVAEIDGCDLLIVAVKNYHLVDAVESLRPLVEGGAKVLPLLNGVGHLEVLQGAFGAEAVLGGFCNIIVTLNEQGNVVHTSKSHDYTFGALQPGQMEFCQQFLELAQSANLNVTHSETVYSAMWQKYVFITAFSGVTTASRLPIDQVLQTEASREVLKLALLEMHALANLKGANLPDGMVEGMLTGMGKLAAGSTSSMHQDFRKGHTLEVESLQGTALRMATGEGLELPTIRTLYGLIKPYEHPSADRASV